jgi:hypothetical protein
LGLEAAAALGLTSFFFSAGFFSSLGSSFLSSFFLADSSTGLSSFASAVAFLLLLALGFSVFSLAGVSFLSVIAADLVSFSFFSSLLW